MVQASMQWVKMETNHCMEHVAQVTPGQLLKYGASINAMGRVCWLLKELMSMHSMNTRWEPTTA
jgi:hypothetical protein